MNFINFVRSVCNEYKTRQRCFTRPFSPPSSGKGPCSRLKQGDCSGVMTSEPAEGAQDILMRHSYEPWIKMGGGGGGGGIGTGNFCWCYTQGLTFLVSPLEGSAKQVRSAFYLFTCLHSLDNKVLHGLDQDPSLTVFCPVSAAEGSTDVQTIIFFWLKKGQVLCIPPLGSVLKASSSFLQLNH